MGQLKHGRNRVVAKPLWLFKQSAVIPYLEKNGVVEVVVVSSRKKSGWVIPKGVIERSMTPEDSAAKEALEEAGVIGRVSNECLGEYSYKKWGGICNVKVFPMEVATVLESWQEDSIRERRIVELAEAIDLVKPEIREVLPEILKYLIKCDSK